jgi:hypothetical protein
MTILPVAIACAFALAATAVPSFGQTSDASCIVAGRLGDAGWAPRMQGVQLLAGDGSAVAGFSKSALAAVKQVACRRRRFFRAATGTMNWHWGRTGRERKPACPPSDRALSRWKR